MMELISIRDLFEAERRKELRAPNDSAGRVVRDKAGKPKPPAEKNTQDAVRKRIDAQNKRKKTIAAKRKKDMAAAAETNRVDREARLARMRSAKKEPAKEPSLSTVPSQIAHCMMAVHLKRGKSKRAAWNICRWAMTKYGYLKGPYRINDKLPKTTAPTAKGARRNFQHGMEKGPLNRGVKGNGPSKFKKFLRLFKDLEPKIVPKKQG